MICFSVESDLPLVGKRTEIQDVRSHNRVCLTSVSGTLPSPEVEIKRDEEKIKEESRKNQEDQKKYPGGIA